MISSNMRRESLQRRKGIEIVGNKVCWIIHGCRYYHDRDCLEVKQIASERFAASEEIPDKEICPKCQRRIYIRKACYPNTKQIGVCDKILRDHGVSLGEIKHCVMEVGMKFHATSMEEIMIL